MRAPSPTPGEHIGIIIPTWHEKRNQHYKRTNEVCSTFRAKAPRCRTLEGHNESLCPPRAAKSTTPTTAAVARPLCRFSSSFAHAHARLATSTPSDGNKSSNASPAARRCRACDWAPRAGGQVRPWEAAALDKTFEARRQRDETSQINSADSHDAKAPAETTFLLLKTNDD